MKGKLVKENDYHYYLSIDGKIIADINAHPLSSINVRKLSKQNCDEIFEAVDTKEVIAKKMNDYNIVDKAVDFSNANPENNGAYLSYIAGAYEAFSIMESNKDKVFTLSDMKRAFNCGRDSESIDRFEDWRTFTNFINSLRPTEIEVEIEMKRIVDETKVVGAVKGVKGSGNKITTYKSIPKLDSNGCLILKKAR